MDEEVFGQLDRRRGGREERKEREKQGQVKGQDQGMISRERHGRALPGHALQLFG